MHYLWPRSVTCRHLPLFTRTPESPECFAGGKFVMEWHIFAAMHICILAWLVFPHLSNWIGVSGDGLGGIGPSSGAFCWIFGAYALRSPERFYSKLVAVLWIHLHLDSTHVRCRWKPSPHVIHNPLKKVLIGASWWHNAASDGVIGCDCRGPQHDLYLSGLHLISYSFITRV